MKLLKLTSKVVIESYTLARTLDLIFYSKENSRSVDNPTTVMLICVLFKLNLNKFGLFRTLIFERKLLIENMEKARTIADLRIGEKAFVSKFRQADLSLKLLEMGCLPGAEVMLDFVAPLGDPIGILVNGYCLAMRKAEAATVEIEESI